MLRVLVLFCFLWAAASGVAAQGKAKNWTEWTKKEVDATLNESAWAKTQQDTNTSEQTFSPTTATGGGRDERGQFNQEVWVKYRIRFLSAKPIRAAVAQMVNLQQAQPNNPQVIEQMGALVDRDFSQFIVVAVTMETNDRRFGGPRQQEINAAIPATLKNTSYLERNDGKRIFLMDYRAPINDGLGAKFIFPREVDGKPFLDKDSGNIRFVADLGRLVKLNMRFKVKDMIYDGNLEY
jgi:hypothetical protein